MAILREEGNDREVKQGDKLQDFRGDTHTVISWYSKPAPSTGRVVTDRGAFYPHVIGCYLEQGCGNPNMHEKFADRGIEDQCPHCPVVL